jgi:hypothetical protein
MALWLETTDRLNESRAAEGDYERRGLNSSSYEAVNMARHCHPHLVRLSPNRLTPFQADFQMLRVS